MYAAARMGICAKRWHNYSEYVALNKNSAHNRKYQTTVELKN
jgi:hypothetical protein